jgi:hypothetical protein
MRLKCTFLLVALLLTGDQVAAAPRRAAAEPADKVSAKQFFHTGKALFKHKRYNQAIEAFEKAWVYWKHHSILFNIALCHAFLGQKAKAGEYVRRFLKVAPPKQRALPEQLQRILRETGVLVVRAPRAKAAIYLAGRPVGRGQARLVVVAGQYAVDLRLGDRVVARAVVTVPGGGRKEWAPRVRGAGATATDPAGSGATAGPRGSAPPEPGEPADRPRRRKVHWAWFASLAGLAAVAAGAAVGMGVRTRDLRDDFLADRSNASLRDDTVQSMNITNALWGVAGATAIAAGVLAFFTRWRKKERGAPAVSVLPGAGPGGVGVSVRWEH